MREAIWRYATTTEINYAIQALKGLGKERDAELMSTFQRWDNTLDIKPEEDAQVKVLLKPGRLFADTEVWLIPDNMTIKEKWLPSNELVFVGLPQKKQQLPVLAFQSTEDDVLAELSMTWRLANVHVTANMPTVMSVCFDDFESFGSYFYACSFSDQIQVIDQDLDEKRAWLSTPFDHLLADDVIKHNGLSRIMDEWQNSLLKKAYQFLTN
jgi:hypothetical protein